MRTGLIHIYTGEGKGKTTSAVGLGVRALSHGLRVCYSYFNKKPAEYGDTEIGSLEKLGAKIIEATNEHPSSNKMVTKEEHKIQTQNSFNALDRLIHNEHFDMLIMDEILISVRDGFLEENKLVEFIKNKPISLELIMTGRGATDQIIELADYVSYIENVKHPFDKGITSREGIEF
ncbi:MAG: cob(I)yrinic acid a,c-diamide adenosyltransferase [Bacteroidales bacterium]|nr:cob(I)yrinic acid a,c-diamide adenosyltransferase [Bacteroidales bacterium]